MGIRERIIDRLEDESILDTIAEEMEEEVIQAFKKKGIDLTKVIIETSVLKDIVRPCALGLLPSVIWATTEKFKDILLEDNNCFPGEENEQDNS